MSTLQDIFKPVGAQPVASKGDPDIYKVSYKDGLNGEYKSIIRFVPFPQNTAKCVMSKQVTWLKNPITKQGMYIDDPRSINQFSPVCDLFFQLWNTKLPQWQNFAKEHLSTKDQHASLVQIIQDNQHPELVGKFKIFIYGKTIFDKLYAEEHPVAGMGINPFHPIYGRYFSIVCTCKSNFNNFDKSCFFDNKNTNGETLPTGLWVVNAAGQTEVVNENSDQAFVCEYLNANCPDLNKCDYKAWTSEQEKYVMETLETIRQVFKTGGVQNNAQTAYQYNMQAVNTPGPNIPVNTNPTFPGATMQPSAPTMESVIPAPATPADSGTPIASAVPNIGPSIGQSAVPAPGAAGLIQGAVPPTVAPAAAPAAPASATPAIGDISSFINEL